MLKFCITSFLSTRLFYISIITTVFSFNLIGRYDLSSELINIDTYKNTFEKYCLKFLAYFNSYDATLFIDIAKHSYNNDAIFAFFPFYPMLIRCSTRFFNIFLSGIFINENTLYLISGFLLSNVFCLINVILLYSLTWKLTNSIISAKISSVLFLINPGSVFYISMYSENLYLMLELLLIITLINSPGVILSGLILIIGLNATRSNSLFLCSFFVIPCLSLFFNKSNSYDPNSFSFNLSRCFKVVKSNMQFIGRYVVMLIHSFLIFLWVSKYEPRKEICLSINKQINASSIKYALFDQFCNDKAHSKINSVYSFIQAEYWKVGFLSQYKIDKLDRLLLALPMNLLSIYIIWTAISYFDFKSLLRLDLERFLFKNKPSNDIKHTNQINIKEHGKLTERDVLYNTFLLGGLINYIVLFLVVLLIAHPQINNRQMTACPLLYLIASDEVVQFIKSGKFYLRGFLIILFFITFSILGCVMQVGSYGFA